MTERAAVEAEAVADSVEAVAARAGNQRIRSTMDPLIIDRTPKGSALLAYGTSRGPGWNWKLLAIAAGSLAIVLLLGGAAWFLTASTEVPSRRLLTVTVQPRAAADVLDPALRRDLAAPWRAAVESRSHAPAILGTSLDANGRLRPFALVARTAGAMEPGLTATPSGAFVLLTSGDGGDTETERVPVRTLFRDAWLPKKDHAFVLRTDLLVRFALPASPAETPVEELRGRWSGRTGTLDVTADGRRADGAVAGPLFAILGDDTDARPVVAGLLSQGIDLRGLSRLPQAIALDPASGGSVALYWDKALSSPDDAGILLAAQGRGARQTISLPDVSEMIEILPGADPSTTINGSTMLFLGEGLASSTFDFIRPLQTCPGTVRFSYEGEALQQMLESLSVPPSWKSLFHGVRITESENIVRICLE